MIVFAILWNELEVKGTTDSQKYASSRDLDLEIDNRGRIKTKLYDITFPIVNFPFNSSSIPASPSYEVYISQLMGYSWASAQYSDFLDRYQLLTKKLRKQDYVAPRLKSSLQQLYFRHQNLVDRYEISISQMTMDHLLFT